MANPATYRPKPGEIPQTPGVYRFSDEQGRVIYVGKAVNLRSRLNSYFSSVGSLHSRTQTMLRTAARVEWTTVRNEVEALQLEFTWIKQFQPRFNIKYRDDKSYPWAAVTWSQEYPRVFVGRGVKRKGNRYFGPYAQAWAIRETIDSLLGVFPMRSCTDGTFRDAERAGRPCLLGHIGKCDAPCVGKINAQDHRALVSNVCDFLAGRTSTLAKTLEAEMQDASQALEFERAATLRDKLAALVSVSERNAVVFDDGTDADVVAIADDPLEVAVTVFHVRAGRVRGQRSWVADRQDDTDLAGLLETFLIQLYADLEAETELTDAIPPLILVPQLPKSKAVLTELLSQQRGTQVAFRVPQRGDKRAILEMVAKNASEVLALHKMRRASDLSTRSRALDEIKAALNLADAPLRIECFDISHLQGSDVVASMVVFEDGLSKKSQYRRFVLKQQESNDVAAIHEVILRRFTRLLEDQGVGAGQERLLIDPTTGAPLKFAYAPQLVVVDGGAPQVSAAQAALTKLGLDIPLCGLAKRLEEVWVPGEEFPVIFSRSSEGLFLLQRVRDEAHRFAITHHRSRRSKTMLESVLDQVSGLGEVRRKALLKHFSSVKKLRQASVDDVAQVPGIGAQLAATIVSALAESTPGSAINMATGEVIDAQPDS
ncbi:MAG: excinuclease ABC subunit UvrC [Propionibacteriaceae bacterium]|nr:excinuclease ABC subunit UvrC [Propionibacteriaceae bacterium]